VLESLARVHEVEGLVVEEPQIGRHVHDEPAARPVAVQLPRVLDHLVGHVDSDGLGEVRGQSPGEAPHAAAEVEGPLEALRPAEPAGPIESLLDLLRSAGEELVELPAAATAPGVRQDLPEWIAAGQLVPLVAQAFDVRLGDRRSLRTASLG
jgi:hypothetical protein